MKILLCHVFVPALPGNAGGPELACQVTLLAHLHEYTLGIPTCALPSATSDDMSSSHHRRVVSHIELIISDSKHTLAPFPHIMYNKHISLELY